MTVYEKRGFTLIELSIVLVIIGLIVGGVLIGSELIKAAETRAQITQIEKYRTAVRAFQLKYNCMPGDCTQAVTFGFQGGSGGQYDGDGDGLIVGMGPNNIPGAAQTKEPLYFWEQLSGAQLIDAGLNTYHGELLPPAPINQYYPRAKLGGHVYVYSDLTYNYYTVFSGALTLAWLSGPPSISTQQASEIDQKVDDGYPQSGLVTAMDVQGSYGVWLGGDGGPGDTTTATPPSTTTCYDDGGTTGARRQYSIGQNGGRGINCGLSFRF